MLRLTAFIKPLLAALALCFVFAQPVLAEDLLASFEGSWTGAGVVTGPNAGKVTCKMQFTFTNAAKLKYSGRCGMSGGSASFSGTLVYDTASGRYVAVGTAQGASTNTVGKASGNSIVFQAEAIDTKYGVASSTMRFSPGTIQVSFKLVDTDGEVTTSDVTLNKS